MTRHPKDPNGGRAALALFLSPALPLPAGERIVQIRNWDVAANDPEPRALHDFIVWRGVLRSVTELGAWRDVTRPVNFPSLGSWQLHRNQR